MPDRRKVCDTFWRLVDTMAQLRGPRGCPWDRAQTPRDLRNYVIEEAYELVHALTEDAPDRVLDELGDLLLQVVFLARIYEEAGHFSIVDVARHLTEKLRRRHPHVFGNATADTPEQVLQNWETMKARERGHRTVVERLQSVSPALPALAEAWVMQRKAAQVGFDWTDWRAVLQKVREELEELVQVADRDAPDRIEEELGDLLFAVVNLCRHFRVNPEVALKRANRKFIERYGYMEQALQARGLSPEQVSLEEMDRLWEEAKHR